MELTEREYLSLTEDDTRHFSEDAIKKVGESGELYNIDGASHMDLYYKDK